MCAINFACYSSDDSSDDESPRVPVTKARTEIAPKKTDPIITAAAETAVVPDEHDGKSQTTPDQCEDIDEPCIGDPVVEEAADGEAEIESASVEEAIVEEAPEEKAPVEEAPVEEAPVEEAPVEEAPVKEAPVEEEQPAKKTVSPWRKQSSEKSEEAEKEVAAAPLPASSQDEEDSSARTVKAPWRSKTSMPWRSKSAALEGEALQAKRPWRKDAQLETNEIPQEEEALIASLSDDSTATPTSTMGDLTPTGRTGLDTPPTSPCASDASPDLDIGQASSTSSDTDEAQEAEEVKRPLPVHRGSLTGEVTRLGPQQPMAQRPKGETFSLLEMMRWCTVASAEGLVDENVTYTADVVEISAPKSGPSSTPKSNSGGWREDAARTQRPKGARGDRRSEGKADRGPRRQTKEDEAPSVLQQSETSWAARQKERRARLNSEGKSDEEIVRAMKSILNKLTIEKYDTLYKQMLTCGMSKVEHVEILIHEIMEKAQTQHHFIEMYSQFCAHLHEWFVDNQISDDPKHGFKRILLNECQNLFEKNLKPADMMKLEGEELAEAKAKYKITMLGNIKFVGALLGRRMLATSVLIAVAEDLVSEPCTAESLESLAVFLTSVGGTFDRPDWQHHKRFEAIFDKVAKKKSDKSTPPRIRFLLQDVLDLRASGWENTKKATAKSEGPMKLDEVHEKAACEEKRACEEKQFQTVTPATPSRRVARAY